MSDIWRRIGALALAIYVWTWINIRVTDRQIVSGVPIHISYDQNKMQIMSATEQVRDFVVQFRGKDIDSNWMLASSYEFQLHMPDTVKGTVTLEFDKEQLEVIKKPTGVTLKDMQPSKIRVTADEIIETWLEIAHLPSKVKPNGDLIRFLTPQPARVKVRGPSRIVNNLQALPLKEPDLSMPFGSTVRLQIDNPDRTCLTITPAEVVVNVEKQTMEEQDFEKITPFLLLPPNTDLMQGTAALPSVTVRLHGSVKDITELKAGTSPFRVFLDLSDVGDVGPWTRKVLVAGLPNGVEIVKVEPETIHDILLKRREVPPSKPVATVDADDADKEKEDKKPEKDSPVSEPNETAPKEAVKPEGDVGKTTEKTAI